MYKELTWFFSLGRRFEQSSENHSVYFGKFYILHTQTEVLMAHIKGVLRDETVGLSQGANRET